MLNNTSVLLTGSETFEQAFNLIPDNKPVIRFLKTEDGESTGVYQIYDKVKEKFGSPRMSKFDKQGKIIPINDSKQKLKNTELFYDMFTTPTHAGSFDDKSWLIGDIEHCEIQNEEYNIQGFVISSYYEPTPKFYISFERLVCENQFGSLGTNSSSMYVDMNRFLNLNNKEENRERLKVAIYDEIGKRLIMQNEVYNKLKSIHLTDQQVEDMFKKLTIDKVAKNNSIAYKEQEKLFEHYRSTYNCDDNQNYKGTFMGFINTCTNINTRKKTNPLDIIKPIISPSILTNPCNLEYLYRDVLVNAA